MKNNCHDEAVSTAHIVEKTINYTFRDINLLVRALTHSSYANEHGKAGIHYERLEFLGDAVLELASSEYLFNRYADKPEGELSKIRASMVCEPSLAECARKMKLDESILLGHGELLLGGNKRDSIVSDVLEALIGAIYLDGGMSFAKAFIDEFILRYMDEIRLFVDSKTRFQEMVQEKNLKPVYQLEKEEGPDHNKMFFVNVSVDGKIMGRGQGHTKKAAQQMAATEAIINLEKEKSECI
ncbi:MAG: ribonuclease III [Lachnospiraceae bacterium]|jgi:ribonuclease-3